MKFIQSLYRKYSFILWCLIFMVVYVCYLYYVTHVVLSTAYVHYLSYSMNLVSKGVVAYLLGSFAFFMICILLEACVSAIFLWLLRKLLVRLSSTIVDQTNVFSFSNVCNILLNFFIAVGFVFLLGIKDNFFEMYYILFEEGLDETRVTVERMAYDVEINWIFCDLLVFKMLFETIFQHDALDKLLPHPEEENAPTAVDEPVQSLEQ